MDMLSLTVLLLAAVDDCLTKSGPSLPRLASGREFNFLVTTSHQRVFVNVKPVVVAYGMASIEIDGTNPHFFGTVFNSYHGNHANVLSEESF